jgi:hypothetical protein
MRHVLQYQGSLIAQLLTPEELGKSPLKAKRLYVENLPLEKHLWGGRDVLFSIRCPMMVQFSWDSRLALPTSKKNIVLDFDT